MVPKGAAACVKLFFLKRTCGATKIRSRGSVLKSQRDMKLASTAFNSIGTPAAFAASSIFASNKLDDIPMAQTMMTLSFLGSVTRASLRIAYDLSPIEFHLRQEQRPFAISDMRYAIG